MNVFTIKQAHLPAIFFNNKRAFRTGRIQLSAFIHLILGVMFMVISMSVSAQDSAPDALLVTAYTKTMQVNAIHYAGQDVFSSPDTKTIVNDCAVTGAATTTAACTGSSNGSATITLSGTGSGAPGTYSLDGGAGQSFGTNPFTVTGLTAGNHTVIATVTAGGCISSPILITVATSPLPTITAAASASIICNGSVTTLTAAGASTYTWMPGSLSGSSVSVSPTATTTYTVTGTNAAGCVGGNIWASVSAGGSHNLAIKTDGTLWAWGDNTYGQLGDGTNTLKKIPVQIGTATNWVMVSGGNNHSLAIRSDGTLWAWGYNGLGMLGDGTIIDKNVPVQIGVGTTWVTVCAAGSHSIAMKTGGSLWAWGYNNYGQLGDGTFTQRNTPIQIGVATNWSAISAASDHTLAIKADGTLWSWGRNTFGQLGDGTINSRNTPGQVGIATDWSKINVCYYHNLAIKTDGTLWAWGYNIFNQLGDGTTTQRNSPVQIGVATDWSAVEGGLYHSLAIKNNGTAWAWGYNMYGQLGDGTQTQRNTPVQVGTATNWSLVSAGLYHTEALGTAGSLWSWGYNNSGQLGDGTMFLKTIPTQIGSTVVSVTVSVNTLPTVSFSGLSASYCLTAPPATLTGSPAGGTFSGPGIGGNTFNAGSAGTGTHTITYAYTDINGCSKSSTQTVSVVFSNALDYVNLQFPGAASFCQGGSLTAYGQIYEPGLTEAPGQGAGVVAEFGYSTSNTNPASWTNWQPAVFNTQVGNNDEYSSTLTLPAGTYYYTFRYAYTANTCGYQYGGFSAAGGNAWDGTNYVSGILTVNPFPTVTVSSPSVSVCTGSSTTLTASGASTYTWMPGSLSGTSIAVSPVSNTTYTVTGTSAAGCSAGNSWASISAGGYHNLAIKTDGTLWVSGVNANGQLGDGTTADKFNAVKIGSGNNWVMVSAGSFHSLAIKSDGTLWGWGSNANGQIGDGTVIDKNAPVQIGTATNWAIVSAGGNHSLALKTDGSLWGWGLNSYGQVGDNTFTQRNSPVQVATETNWASISAGGSHSLGIKKDGTLWAWGRGSSGQVGDGAAVDRYSPVQIGPGQNWRKIAACFFHSLAIKTDGTLWSWGRNMEGQIGDGTVLQRNSPVPVGSATNWENVAGGLNHSLGTRTTGALWAWGGNLYGQLGNGTQVMTNSTPVQTGVLTNWMLVDAGSYHTMSIKNDASLWAFGRNMEGQLGDGTSLTFQLMPEQIGPALFSVSVTVNSLPVVSFSGLASAYCANAAAANITGSPAGGIFTGSGISGNIFDPAVAGAGGPYSITYTYTNANGCIKSSTQTVTVYALPVVSFSGLAASYCATDAPVTLTGNPAGGVFTGIGITGSNFNPNLAGTAGPYTITYTYTDMLSGCSNAASKLVTVNTCSSFTTLNLKLFLQGFYTGANQMQANRYDLGMETDPTATDMITVCLWDPAHLSNATADYSVTAMLHTNGTAVLQFPAGVNGNSFYISIKHRNSIETWSKLPVTFTTSTTYDFSTSSTQAYDDGINPPMVSIAGVYAIYGGDVNQDGTVDISDAIEVQNNSNLFAYGYDSTDVTGDGATDLSDAIIVQNNGNLFLFYARPF